jgi:hypothetical protein
VIGTAAGVVGGAVIGTKFARKPKKVLGMSIPGTGGGLNGLTKEVGKAAKQFKKAGKQFNELADEVKTVRAKAEKVGNAVS